MTDKLWFRKSDGALVRPTMREPSTLENEDDWNIWSWNIWRKHLSSLPALTDVVVDPEYAKTLNDGWVKVERVRWEVKQGYWIDVLKPTYDIYPDDRRRLVILAPVAPSPEDMEHWSILNHCLMIHGAKLPDDSNALQNAIYDAMKQAASGSDAVEFAEWLRTFEALSRENGQWVIESQVSSEKLYQHFLKSKQHTP